MTVILVITICAVIILSIYLLYYRRQIKAIADQLDFISKHDSFKFIHSQIKPKEISRLIDLSNNLLQDQRELKQQFNDKNEEINTTIVSLSHDIRTPLTSLDGYLQLALKTNSTQKKQNYILQSQSKMHQINSLVDELFLYTKLENKAYKLELESIDVVTALEKSLLSYFNAFSQRDDEPNILLPKTPFHIKGNISALERVFENIIKNYLLHGEGILRVLHRENDNQLILFFINDLKEGKTIDTSNIFTRFYKEDISRTNHSTGLGLFIVKALMEKMNGTVSADTEENQFRLQLVFNKAG